MGIVFAVSILVFAATNVIPGDAARAILGLEASPQTVAALRKELGQDRPLVVRYLDWAGDLVRGDLGTSYAARRPVADVIRDPLENTLILAALGMALVVPTGIALGVWTGIRRGGFTDHVISNVSLVAVAVPDFVWATIIALVLGVELAIFPPVSVSIGPGGPLSHPSELALPIITMMVIAVPYTSRQVRAGIVEVMASEFVSQAELSGIRRGRLVRKYALRNALGPTVQIVAATLHWFIGGIFVIETIFSYPGLGRQFVQAVQVRDLPYVASVSVLIASAYVAINIVADIVIIWLIPKLRTSV